MRWYFDQDIGKLVIRPGTASLVPTYTWKRGDRLPFELSFHKGSTDSELGAEPVIRFGLKVVESGELLALAHEWTLVDGLWKTTLDLNTGALLTTIGTKSTLTVKGELSFSDASGGPTSSQTLSIIIENDVLKEDDDDPTALPPLGFDPVLFALLMALLSEDSDQRVFDNGEGGVAIGTWNPDTRTWRGQRLVGTGLDEHYEWYDLSDVLPEE